VNDEGEKQEEYRISIFPIGEGIENPRSRINAYLEETTFGGEGVNTTVIF
jgi:hypothetical protein